PRTTVLSAARPNVRADLYAAEQLGSSAGVWGGRVVTDARFRRVGVVGLGLIGGSLALRMGRSELTVLCSDVDARSLEAAAQQGLEVYPDIGPWVRSCDLVVVATPLDT